MVGITLGLLETSRLQCWGRLALNSTGHAPSRSIIGHHWFRLKCCVHGLLLLS